MFSHFLYSNDGSAFGFPTQEGKNQLQIMPIWILFCDNNKNVNLLTAASTISAALTYTNTDTFYPHSKNLINVTFFSLPLRKRLKAFTRNGKKLYY